MIICGCMPILPSFLRLVTGTSERSPHRRPFRTYTNKQKRLNSHRRLPAMVSTDGNPWLVSAKVPSEFTNTSVHLDDGELCTSPDREQQDQHLHSTESSGLNQEKRDHSKLVIHKTVDIETGSGGRRLTDEWN